ncbi:MAG: hypothetical protein KatS3mg014_2523 [Actinomycetota bacterium]|nr:MAG: hypothetical protein KatS3mg014_2482 [Actinomycetota bacterium]GIV00908.1 MAG: hypothetical protein KatS3mg014_2523 [Actinomycetota bacterium]
MGEWEFHPEPVPRAVTGWRAWRACEDGLCSLFHEYSWSPGANHATCLAPKPCPGLVRAGCTCGFWATRSRSYLEGLIGRGSVLRSEVVVFGVVALWGRVVEATAGWRGEHARVLGVTHALDGSDAMGAAAWHDLGRALRSRGFVIWPPEEVPDEP